MDKLKQIRQIAETTFSKKEDIYIIVNLLSTMIKKNDNQKLILMIKQFKNYLDLKDEDFNEDKMEGYFLILDCTRNILNNIEVSKIVILLEDLFEYKENIFDILEICDKEINILIEHKEILIEIFKTLNK